MPKEPSPLYAIPRSMVSDALLRVVDDHVGRPGRKGADPVEDHAHWTPPFLAAGTPLTKQYLLIRDQSGTSQVPDHSTGPASRRREPERGRAIR